MTPTTTQALLDRLKIAKRINSDYALAKHLGVSTSRLSNWRSGNHEMDDTTAVQVAQELGANPLEVLALLKLAQPHKPREGRIWERYRPRVLAAALAASAVVGIYAASGQPLTRFNESQVTRSQISDTIYIMRSWLRKLKKKWDGYARSAERGPVAGFAPLASLTMLTLRATA